MPPRHPWAALGARALVTLERQARRADRILCELLVAIHSPELERSVIDAHYRGSSSYVGNQRAGLHPFEARALDAWFPRPPARLLVAGAGGGREVLGLRERGYEIDAFEPVASLVEAAKRATRGDAGARIERATLQAWSDAPGGRYDGIVVGWGVWGHMLRHDDRVRALRAFRRACPSGPVLLSFLRHEPVFDHLERPTPLEPLHPAWTGRLERLTRGWIRTRVLGMPPLERGTDFQNGVFFHYATEAELTDEAARTGWRVAHYERDASRYPNAVLVPADAGARD